MARYESQRDWVAPFPCPCHFRLHSLYLGLTWPAAYRFHWLTFHFAGIFKFLGFPMSLWFHSHSFRHFPLMAKPPGFLGKSRWKPLLPYICMLCAWTTSFTRTTLTSATNAGRSKLCFTMAVADFEHLECWLCWNELQSMDSLGSPPQAGVTTLSFQRKGWHFCIFEPADGYLLISEMTSRHLSSCLVQSTHFLNSGHNLQQLYLFDYNFTCSSFRGGFYMF